MNYAHLVGEAPVEIPNGWPFNTATMLIQTAEDAEAFDAPIGTVLEASVSHASNALELLAEGERARFGILEIVEPAAPPAGQVIVSTALQMVGQAVHRVAEYAAAPPSPVPWKVSKLQADLTFHFRGLTAAVLAAVDHLAEQDEAIRIYWNGASDYHRDHFGVAFVATEMGWSAEYVDGLFIEAGSYF